MAQKYDLNNLGNVKGLSEKEAAERLSRDGFNEIPSAKKRSIFSMAISVIREPMLLLLLASGTIYMVLGDIQEALMLLSFVFVIIGITLYQERKTERTLEALRDLSSPRALVIRNGEQKRIAGREVVKDDIIVIKEGDRVPADAVLTQSEDLQTDESLLTGESVPVRKIVRRDATPSEQRRPGGDDLPGVEKPHALPLVVDLVEEFLVAGLGEPVQQLGVPVEVVLDRPLVAPGDEEDLLQALFHHLFHDVLDHRLPAHGEHLLGLGLGGRKQAGAQTRYRDHDLFDFHPRTPSGSVRPEHGA